jgi:hypothetical protein
MKPFYYLIVNLDTNCFCAIILVQCFSDLFKSSNFWHQISICLNLIVSEIEMYFKIKNGNKLLFNKCSQF